MVWLGKIRNFKLSFSHAGIVRLVVRTQISPQLTIDDKDRIRHWIKSVDHKQPDAVVDPNQELHVRSIASEQSYPVLASSMVTSSFAGVNNGQAASRDPGLYFSNQIQEQRHILSILVQQQL